MIISTDQLKLSNTEEIKKKTRHSAVLRWRQFIFCHSRICRLKIYNKCKTNFLNIISNLLNLLNKHRILNIKHTKTTTYYNSFIWHWSSFVYTHTSTRDDLYSWNVVQYIMFTNDGIFTIILKISLINFKSVKRYLIKKSYVYIYLQF